MSEAAIETRAHDLRDHRLRAGMTQWDLAGALGCTQQLVSAMEVGSRGISETVAGRLVELFPGTTLEGWKR